MINLHYPKYNNLANILGSSESTYLVPLRIPITTPEWPSICNPSIFIDGDKIRLILRNVNYILHNSIDPYRFWSSWGPVHYLTPEYDYSHLRTRNWICEYAENRIQYNLIDTSENDVPEQWDFVGLEDARLVRWENRLLAIGVRRDDNPTGVGRMEIMEITEDGKELSRMKIEVPWDSYCEKNWVPIIDMPWHFMRTSNPTCIVKIDLKDAESGVVYAEKVIEKQFTDISRVEGIYNSSKQGDTLFRGSSQVIPYKDDTHIAIVHTCELYLNEMKRKVAKYLHHFILWDNEWNIIKISPAFSFNNHHIEFTNGLAYQNGIFYIPFALQDGFSYLIESSDINIDKLLDGNLDLSENMEFLPNASIYYNNYDGFEAAEKEAEFCLENNFISEAYCRYWRMYERSFEFPISREKQISYLIKILYSIGYGIRDLEAYNIISILEATIPDNPEILMIIANFFLNRGLMGMARTYRDRAIKNMDAEFIFHYINESEFFNIKNNIDNDRFETATVKNEVEIVL